MNYADETNQIFLSIERCVDKILLNVSKKETTSELADIWNWDLICMNQHPRDIQLIAQCPTAKLDPSVRRFVLGMHLQAISDAVGKQQQNQAHAHLKEVFLRYERYKQLSMASETRVCEKMLDAIDSATNKLLQLYLPLLKGEAGRYYKKRPFLSFDETMQNMRIGLLNAIRTYSSSNPFSFSTHAHYYMMMSQNRNYEKSFNAPFSISTEEYYKLFQMKAFIEECTLIKGYSPTFEEIADKIGCSLKRVKDLASFPIYSVDLEDWNGKTEHTEQEYVHNEETNILNSLIDALPYPTSEIIKKYFGLQDCEERKIQQIAQELNISEGSVKWFKQKGLTTLKENLVSLSHFDDI